VILGLDGMEPSLAERYMAEGKLPNLSRLREQGSYKRLGTTAPPLSPVAWSSFLTCCNPGKHRIFDFLTRDARTYRPRLSSVQIEPPLRCWRLGPWRIPRGGPQVRLLRKGQPFWNLLGRHGIFSAVVRVPITFPPEPFRGVLLSAMCVPDLRGSQGTFSFYSTRNGDGHGEYTGGERMHIVRRGRTIDSVLVGPENTLRPGAGPMHCPFRLTLRDSNRAALRLCGQTVELRPREYSPWLEFRFRAGPGIKVHGICQFLLLRTEPEVEFYVTPLQIDPRRPALPISHPRDYARYLACAHQPYATLGLAEDTWALNEHILDDDTFLQQCLQADSEREAMFFDALRKVRRGFCVCVFDGTDRIQHMFWRYLDPEHPAHAGQGAPQRRDAIEAHYRRLDDLVGRTAAACAQDDTVLMVVSDHGFNSFRRGIDLNFWLEQNGYLRRRPDASGRRYLADVDWSATRAYALGLAGIWLNVRGREEHGIVEPGDAAGLCDELCRKLTGLRDEERGASAISRAFAAGRIYDGPYAAEAPDIIVGYDRGYRVCWETAVGQLTGRLLHDNVKAWSGDHCIDPKLIPGVLFCNRKISDPAPRLMDLGCTVLDLFGVDVPAHMDGKPLRVAEADGTFDDDLDPEALSTEMQTASRT
jgi:predicted AlkP superfamily phosphohydrolase/phosphomutase